MTMLLQGTASWHSAWWRVVEPNSRAWGEAPLRIAFEDVPGADADSLGLDLAFGESKGPAAAKPL
jgi:hypothetical protein